MMILGFFITAAYWPGVFSPAMAPKWVALSLAAPALLLWQQQTVPLTRAHLAGGALVLWAAVTVLWSPVPLDSLNGLWLIAILPAICFILGSQSESLRPFFTGAAIGMGVSSAVAIAQVFGWDALSSINVPSGLFLNRNFMAEATALILVWLIAERAWWLAIVVTPALALTDARGAILALGVALALMLQRRPSLLISGLLLADIGLFAHAMISHGTATMAERTDIWSDASAGVSILGNGIGSFGVVPHKMQADGIPIHAHNDLLELMYDLGFVGLILALLFIRELSGPLSPARLVLVAFAVEACFGFPLHLPTTLCCAAVVAGYAVRDRALVWGVARGGRNFGLPRVASVGP